MFSDLFVQYNHLLRNSNRLNPAQKFRDSVYGNLLDGTEPQVSTPVIWKPTTWHNQEQVLCTVQPAIPFSYDWF
jgi:hypothetical protein